MAPHLELLAHGSRRFDEMPAAVFVGDAEAHRVADIVGLQSSTARSLTTRLRATPILGVSKKVDSNLHSHPPYGIFFHMDYFFSKSRKVCLSF